MEEAERYSRPGSVAEKKAFFEAHYKRLAAQKAAALLEQEQANNAATNKENDPSPHQTSPTSEAATKNEQENMVASLDIPDVNRVEEYQPLVINSMKVESQNQLEDVHSQKDASEKVEY